MTTDTLNKATVLQVTLVNIPDLLSKADQWVGWRIGSLKPNGKYDKIPVNRHLRDCNANQKSNWMPFDIAVIQYKRHLFDGLGFALSGDPFLPADGKDFYLIGIDMDRCVTGNHLIGYTLSDDVVSVWEQLNKPYLEISPSGTGVRMFVLSSEKIESSNRDGNEMYIDKRYLTITGHVPDGFKGEIVDATDAILALHIKWFPNKHKATNALEARKQGEHATDAREGLSADIQRALAFISSDIDRDNWRDIVWAIKASGLTEAENIARNWSKLSPERYTDEGFDNVWRSFNKDKGITLATLFYHAQLNGFEPRGGVNHNQDEGDILNGRLFAAEYRDKLLFIHESGEELIFTSSGWVHAPPGESHRCAKAVVANLKNKAANAFKADACSQNTRKLLSHATKSSQEPRLNAMISMARSEPGMTECLRNFDADSNLIGLINGIYDMSASALVKPTPEIRLSMRSNIQYDPNATCPKWRAFLERVQPDDNVRRLIQQLVGIFLTGDSTLQKIIILYGSGANGKSTLIELVSWLMGDYAHRIPTEMLMQHQRSPQGPSPDIVSLKGRRLVYCNEIEEGRRLDEARVKELTGGDSLTGRAPYARKSTTFRPTHNLVMVGNHKPEIHDMSHGMWRRVLLLPFDTTVPSSEQNQKLLEELKHESAGIFNWALDGLADYKKNGLHIPSSVIAVTEAYKDDEDIIGEWLSENCKSVAGSQIAIADCYKVYSNWAYARGHRPLAQSRFTRRLRDRGYKRDAGKRYYLGLELNEFGSHNLRMGV